MAILQKETLHAIENRIVILVDGNADTRRSADESLVAKGYHLDIARVGEQALDYVQIDDADLAIIDMMPENQAWKAYRQVRAQSDLPVLFIVESGTDRSRVPVRQSDSYDLIRKPYDTQELLQRIQGLRANETRNSSPQKLSEKGFPKRCQEELLTRSQNETNLNRHLKSDHLIVAIIPAYNEERFIGSVVLKTLEYVDKVIVIDDGSSDATSHVAERAGAEVVSHEQNQGKGAALNTAFWLARELNPRAVVLLDADGQHSPEELKQVLTPVLDGQADVVLGSRYIEKRSDVPAHRVWGHWIFNRITHLASGVPASDSQSGYRAFSRRAIQAISFCSEGFSVESEMQFIIKENDLRFVEVPITVRYTDKPKRNVVQHGLMVLNGILRLTGQYRPLLFFGVPGSLVMLAGISMGILVVNIYSRNHELAVGYAMVSVLLAIIGVVMFSTSIILHSIRGLLIDLLREHGRTSGR